jgi:hypothetical protein
MYSSTRPPESQHPHHVARSKRMRPVRLRRTWPSRADALSLPVRNFAPRRSACLRAEHSVAESELIEPPNDSRASHPQTLPAQVSCDRYLSERALSPARGAGMPHMPKFASLTPSGNRNLRTHTPRSSSSLSSPPHPHPAQVHGHPRRDRTPSVPNQSCIPTEVWRTIKGKSHL